MDQIRLFQVMGGNEIGGAEEHVLALCKGLDKARFDVLLVCLCDGPLRQLAQEQGIRVACVPMANPWDLRIVPRLADLIRKEGADIVHTHGSRANLTARLAARWLNKPIVTTVHSSLSSDYTRSFAAYAALFLDRLTTPMASRVITISGYLQKEVKKRGAKQIVTIYNGVDPARFQVPEPRDKVLGELGIEVQGPLIGTIGRLHPVKGQKYFLEAAKLVSLSHSTARFLVVGAGPLEDELRQMALDLHLQDKVIFTGFYPEIQKILSALDLLCLPSLSEGMGLVLLEAMYFGKPVVASRVGGIPELIKHEETGLLVPPRDSILLAAAINRVLEDKTLTSRLTANGQRSFQDFSLERMLEKTAGLYEEILKEKTGPA